MRKLLSGILCLAMSALVVLPASADRIRDLTTVQGVRDNALIGYGLVVGLRGTGDQTTQTPFTTQTLTNMLSQLGITVPAGTNMQLKNVAAVMVTAKMPPFSRAGQAIDVVVSSMGNAKSIRGGTLLMTPMKGVDNQVYALAQGNVLVGGAGASSGGSSVTVNQVSGGRITGGATIERELPSTFGTEGVISLQLNDEDFNLAQQVSDAINRQGMGVASALDSRNIQVVVPRGNTSQVRILAQIQNIEVNVGPMDAKVIINSRTGSVVMNQAVKINDCAVAHGNLSVVIDTVPVISQPNPLAGGETVVTQRSQIEINQGGGALQVSTAFGAEWLRGMVAALSDARLRGFTILQAPDAYFYPRAAEAMNGAAVRRFPVAMADFDDAEATRVYVDLATGDLLLTLGKRERAGRWLFSFLHSWDLPAMLRQHSARLVVLLLLSLAGTALCTTATVIGYRRLRMTLRRKRHWHAPFSERSRRDLPRL